jgi:glycosyltransferase involved in cell wall biosynthesis
MSDAPARLALVTDAWAPQVNGVVNALERVTRLLRARGDPVTIIAPDRFRTLPCPTYPEIRLALASPAAVANAIEESGAEFVHIATEGPLGMLARRHCLSRGRGFTTSYHTRFPEYVSARIPVPEAWTYAIVRRFHNSALACMVATPSVQAELAARGFRNLMSWTRGVDRELFRPQPGADLGATRPVFLYVGRVAVEKNLDAFLSLDLPGTKVVVGDGPARPHLSRQYADAHFLGVLRGEALAHAYAAADVFVFPSLTDTFGNVILEALACGVPVGAFPAPGPRDIITDPRIGALDTDLRKAALAALGLSREAARDFTKRFSWEASAAQFRANILAANRVGARIAA